MRYYELKVTPNTKPRMTKRDRWKKRPCVNQYYAFKDEIKLKANLIGLQGLPGDITSLSFIVPMPDSWSEVKKVRTDKSPHQQRPDLDNFLKGLQDALCKEDKGIWRIGNLEKRWGRVGKIIISIDENNNII
jgi:Holliday junction resolvase RusA-like endonuclease